MSLKPPVFIPDAIKFPLLGFIFIGAFTSAAVLGLLAAGIFFFAVIMKPVVLNLCTIFSDS